MDWIKFFRELTISIESAAESGTNATLLLNSSIQLGI
jgi:hypothetical protein